MDARQPPLAPEQLARYRRHLTLPEFGLEGQRALLDARVLLVGAGGLGCPAAQYLAAAGVGTLGLVDFDRVDASNLQRQILYGVGDIGRPKVDVAAERIRALNPDVRVERHPVRLTAENAFKILAEYDVVVDGSDNFPCRYLVNDACVLLEKPNVHGSVFRFEGQATLFEPRRGPCYRCLYPEPPPPGEAPSCAEAGVLGVLPGLVALIQATETVKRIARIGQPLAGRLLHYDALAMTLSEFRFERDPGCVVCGDHPTQKELIDYEGFCGVGASGEDEVREKEAIEVRAMMERGDPFLLLDVREPQEFEIARIDGARLIPLGALEARLEELDPFRDGPVVVHCHHGGRSAAACRLLRERGFADVWNLAGGIEAWSLTVDPSVPRY